MSASHTPRRGRGDVRPRGAARASADKTHLKAFPPLWVIPLPMEENGVIRLPPDVRADLNLKPGSPLYLVVTREIHRVTDPESYAALYGGSASNAPKKLTALVTMRIEVTP